MSTIGFIGLGTIGSPMAMRLIEAGHALRVVDISDDASRAHEARGAVRDTSPQALAAHCEVVFLSLPGPAQIETVMRGPQGLLAEIGALRTVVDLSTNALALNRDLAVAAQALGIDYLDAPVSGGKAGAAAGKLAVMVGGERAAFEAVQGLLACFAENIFYMGAAGAGTLTKLINNQIFLASSVLIQEGFVMGAKAGMDPRAVLDVLKVSSAGAVVGRAPLVLSRHFEQDIFALAIAAKDIEVALASAAALGTPMPMTTAASTVYQQALREGLGGEDFYATVKVLEAAAGVSVPPLKR